MNNIKETGGIESRISNYNSVALYYRFNDNLSKVCYYTINRYEMSFTRKGKAMFAVSLQNLNSEHIEALYDGTMCLFKICPVSDNDSRWNC